MFTKIRRVARFAAHQWSLLISIVVLSAAGAALAALQPWPLKILVDNAVSGAPLPSLIAVAASLGASGLIVLAALAYVVLVAMSSTIDAAVSYAWTRAGQGMVYDLASELFARLQRMSLIAHFRRPIGDSMSRLSGDTYCLYTIAESVLVSPLRLFITIAVVGTIAWRLDAYLTLLMLVVSPALAMSARHFGRRIAERAKAGRVANARLTSFVQQTLGALPIVQAFHSGEINVGRYSAASAGALAISQQSAKVTGAFGVTNAAVLAIGYGVVMYASAREVAAGALTIGGLVVLLAYLQTLQGAMRGVLGLYSQLKSAEASLDRVLEVLDARDEVIEAPDAILIPRDAARGSIRWHGVRFGYERERAVLDDIELEVRPGETVALVGATGAGKSTLVSLVPRLFDPWQGAVLVNGIDVRRVTLASLRAEIALVLQEPFLLPLTVAENIAYGRPDATRAQIIAAAQAANAHDFIARLPHGYETVIGERGATLSGGERQRLSIARALIRDAPILILDEPTSALDATTERAVMEATQRLMAGRTTVIIAHRLSTVRRADRIVVLEHGRIVETGTQDELMRANRVFARMYRMQAGDANA